MDAETVKKNEEIMKKKTPVKEEPGAVPFIIDAAKGIVNSAN